MAREAPMKWPSRVDSDTRYVGLDPAGWLLARRFAVPPDLSELATRRRLAGNWRGARATEPRLVARTRTNAQEDLADVVAVGAGPDRAIAGN